MKTDAERMALIRQRTAQLQRQARARQMLLIDAGCMAACLALVVCMVLHGIYNLLITADGFWQMVGYFFPSAIIVTLFAARLLHRGRHTVFH